MTDDGPFREMHNVSATHDVDMVSRKIDIERNESANKLLATLVHSIR